MMALDRVFRTGKPESYTGQDHSEPSPVYWSITMWPPLTLGERRLGVALQATKTARFHEKTLALNEALILGSLRQHELAAEAKDLNERLRAEMRERKRAEEVSAGLAAIVESSDDAIVSMDLLFISTEALTMFGYAVLSAADGHEALELWEHRRSAIDLVLTDVRMPKGINGLELAKILLKSKPSLKVIIMSGYSMDVVKSGVSEGAGYTFLSKPFNLEDLGQTVRRCLNQP